MINYTIYENKDSKQWVTFVHGAGGSSSIWFKQIRDFQKHYNVLLLDLRGHGSSNEQIKKAFHDIDVPFLLRPFKSQALGVIEGEINEWIKKAKAEG